ncbi:MAG: phenylalanine--tRNA ligase beta subunit-related protein [Caldilineaceae bacterium]
MEYGQPLHAFDYDILKRRASVGDAKPTIIVRRAGRREVHDAGRRPRMLDDSMLMICDTAGSIAIAGVMGGQESEVSDATVNILLESATFEGINNRRTSTALRLPSEASYRFGGACRPRSIPLPHAAPPNSCGCMRVRASCPAWWTPTPCPNPSASSTRPSATCAAFWASPSPRPTWSTVWNDWTSSSPK